MSFQKQISLFVFILWLVLTGGQAVAAEFSADVLLQQPSESLTVKLYVKGDLYRVENLEEKMLAIENRATDITTALNPEDKTYKEIEGYAGAFVNPIKGWEAMTSHAVETAAGTETVNGFECNHYTYTYEGQTETAFESWVSDKLGFFVKCIAYYSQDQGTGTMQLTNVVEGPQDDALFAVPEGYTREKTPEEIEMERPAVTGQANGEAPMARRIVPGGELIVKVDPDLSSYVRMQNLIKDSSTCRVHYYKAGQKIDFSEISSPKPEEFNLAYKGERTETMSGMQNKADEVRVSLERGRAMVTVYNEYSSFDDTTRQQYYVSPPGRGIAAIEGRAFNIKIVGDSPGAEASTVLVHAYHREYVDGGEQKESIEEQTFELKNGEARTFEYPLESRVNYIVVDVEEGGGLKLFTEQPPAK